MPTLPGILCVRGETSMKICCINPPKPIKSFLRLFVRKNKKQAKQSAAERV